MKIIHCPKGGKVPQGYCVDSCLNYREDHQAVGVKPHVSSWSFKTVLATHFFRKRPKPEPIEIAF